MSLTIAGIATALPPHSISREDDAAIVKAICCADAGQERLIDVLYRRSGVERRHSVLLDASDGDLKDRQSFFSMEAAGKPGPTTAERMARYAAAAPQLATEAAERALRESGLGGGDISHVITVSCTGFMAPGVELQLIQTLGISPGVARTHVGFMGCHGALNGLRVARAFLDATPRANVLLAAVELCSLHFYCGFDREKAVANALFADGAAAVIAVHSSAPLSGSPEAGDAAWRLTASGSLLMPDSAADMTWKILDHGFEMTLSPRVPELIARHIRPWLEAWLSQQELTVADVRSWAVHPGGPKILDVFESAMGLPRTALSVSRAVLAECGNMSSPTTLFIIERLRRSRAPLPCVALGFGPGLAVEAALFR